MRETLGTAVVELGTDDKKLDAGLAGAKGKVKRALDEIDEKAGTVGTSFAQKLGGFLSGAAVGAVVGVATNQLGEAVKVAREAEVQEGRLEAAVDATGVAYKSVRREIDATKESLSHLGFSELVVNDALTLLVSETGSYEEGLKRLPIAMDLARLRHIDLAVAAKLLGRVSDENIKILSRYGIVVDKTATAEDVLAAVQRQSAGQAEKYAGEAQGAADRIANAWEHAQIVAGDAAQNILGPVANLSQVFQGLGGVSLTSAVGGLIGFSKAGTGSLFVITGLTRGLGFLKLAVLGVGGVFGLLAIALGASLVLQQKLVDENRKEAATTVEKRKAYVDLQKTLRDGGMSYDALAISEYEAAKAAGTLEDAIVGGAANAKGAIRSIGDELVDLNKMFRPAAADKTEEFLKALGADPDLINQALDALYNTVGADQATRFKKVTDRAYKELTEGADKEILQEAQDNLKAATDASETELEHLAKVAGASSPKAYIAELKQQLADAEKVAEHYNAQIAKGIQDAREQGQTELDAGNRMTTHLKQIDAIQNAWDSARAASDYYYRGVLSQGFPNAPRPRGEPHDVAPFSGGIAPPTFAGGGDDQRLSIILNQDLHYTGDTVAMASDAAAQATDAITETLRQQQRRLSAVATA